MNGGHELVEQVYAAKTDPDAADSLIRQKIGNLRAETAKYLHRAPIEGQDEELSIVLLAFYEAILGYEKNRGAFLAYASRGIRNRLIDYYRKEKKHANVTSLHEPVQEEDSETLKIDRLEHPENEIESAIRITHIPTGIIVACQTERSQIQNRETAMKMLYSKLVEKQELEEMEKLSAIRGDIKKIEWGSQIRSYVFCPYTLVKDHRTNFETSDVQGVMDGNIQEFINEYLKRTSAKGEKNV